MPPDSIRVHACDPPRELVVQLKSDALRGSIGPLDLEVGEQVLIHPDYEAEPPTNQLTSAEVQSTSRIIEERLMSRVGPRLWTRAGEFIVTESTQPRRFFSRNGGPPYEPVPLGDLKTGDQLMLKAWRDSSRDCFVAVAVGARVADTNHATGDEGVQAE
jgi:hypothetical protein